MVLVASCTDSYQMETVTKCLDGMCVALQEGEAIGDMVYTHFWLKEPWIWPLMTSIIYYHNDLGSLEIWLCKALACNSFAITGTFWGFFECRWLCYQINLCYIAMDARIDSTLCSCIWSIIPYRYHSVTPFNGNMTLAFWGLFCSRKWTHCAIINFISVCLENVVCGLSWRGVWWLLLWCGKLSTATLSVS